MKLEKFRIQNYRSMRARTSKWLELVKFWGNPKVEYQYAFPDDLLDRISRLVLDGLKQSGISIVSSEDILKKNNESVRAILNKAWEVFWTGKHRDFRKWEENSIAILRQICNN